MTTPFTSGAAAIGRYFTVVSFVPSTVFVAYIAVLVRSGVFGDETVDVGAAFEGLELSDAAVFGFASLMVGLALHPLQYPLIQVFEGYWGGTRLGRLLALQHIIRHRERSLTFRADAVNSHHASRPKAMPDQDGELVAQPPYATKRRATPAQVAAFYQAGESWRLHGGYPHNTEAIMPTRLGNVLRKYEIFAGGRYGLDTIAAVPRLMQVAQPRDIAYVNNQRVQMELALRTSTLALVAAMVTAAATWDRGLWMLACLVPYALAYAGYRGAVTVAHEYGVALATLVDLNRFALYERMHVPHPDDTEDEKQQNMYLTDLLRLDNAFIESRRPGLDYAEPPPPPLWPSQPAQDDGASKDE